MASILNVDQINNAAGTSAVTIDPSTGKPSFPNGATLPAGSVVQFQTFALASVRLATSSSTFTATQLTVNITPTSSNSKIYVSVSGSGNNEASGRTLYYTVYRDSTNLGGASGLGQMYSNGGRLHGSIAASLVDSPATTSQVTYTFYVRANNGTVEFPATTAEKATITAMEIAQ